MTYLSGLSAPALLAALVLLTNILTEVTKRVVTVKRPERAALLWALGLSLGEALLRCGGDWRAWLPALLDGFLRAGVAAYAAMFGYDALYTRASEVLGDFVGYLNGGEGHDAEQ